MSYVRVVLVTVGVGIAAACGGRYGLDYRESAAARGWPAVEGQVISSRVAEETRYLSSGGGRMTKIRQYEPRVTYSYDVGGVSRTGSRVWWGEAQLWDSRAEAERFAAGYPLFQKMPVHYDPADPDEAYLVAQGPSIGWLLLAGFGLLVAGLGTRARGRKERSSPAGPQQADAAAHAAEPLEAAVAELEAFARGELPRGHFVVDVPGWKGPEGHWHPGYPDYRPGMDELWAALVGAGLGGVTAEAYNAWLATKRPPLETADQVAAIDDRDELLVRLLAIRRAERFCDGYWTSVLERGLMLSYARRLRELNGRASP